MTRTHTVALMMFALALAATSGTASADAVGPPPDDCPPGAQGVTSHSGQWCVAMTCNTDADCTGGDSLRAMMGRGGGPTVCREVDLCLTTSTYHAGGRGAYLNGPDAPPLTRVIASACTPSCDAPGVCSRAKRCAPAAAVAPPVPAAPPAPPVPAVAPGATPPTPAAAPPAASPTASSGGQCSISARGAVGPALVLLGALALVVLRSPRRGKRRLPPR